MLLLLLLLLKLLLLLHQCWSVLVPTQGVLLPVLLQLLLPAGLSPMSPRIPAALQMHGNQH
jgi:hypothetical protein